MNILLCAQGQDAIEWQTHLHRRLPHAHIRIWSEETGTETQADYALVWKPPTALFDQQQQLKGIINLGAGVDSLLKLPNLPRDVPVLKLRDAGMGRWMNDYIRYGVLHFTRDFDQYRQQQPAHQWRPQDIEPPEAWPVGILGAGALGQQAAEMLQQMGFPVRCWSRTAKQLPGIESHQGTDELTDFLRGVRLLVNLLPNTPDTRGLINDQRLSLLAPGAGLISCGRGEVVDPSAVLHALDSGQLRGALLDVFEQEPLPETSPLWDHPAVLITPHIAAPTPVATAADQIVEYIEQLEAGQVPDPVDPTLGY
ncbi:glyoxylate/hydroxypyruvate reductase A [Marinobacterium sp. AK62]|uniref:Glyoxylate/hydroxypyruvate reductase A n=1 Tax=Marinobacterium alkalitolerans TaxID=1542925 RepID=A0ABS3ZFL8_9GAMM|nr:glyoxylate/hydroxypyruvate reductase A [Marinobacterium alkalitolerans]MBP0050115.1 glyoxylate/hydroxypyruvate reductase A [Marinobacterium alkalitolerans]